MTENARAVFLSYASEDAEAAEQIAAALRGAGIEVWFDRSELRGGDAWDRSIREQIHHCQLFVPIISAHSQARDEGYFRREWALAEDRTRDMAHNRAFLVPVVIDGTPERGALVPEKFLNVQWTRLPGGEATANFVNHVVRLIAAEVPAAGSAGPTPAPTGSRPDARSRRPLRVPLVIGAVLVATMSAWFAWRNHSTTGSAGPTAASEKSIAVLPFADLSEQHDQQYFGDGLAEEIRNMLGAIPGLKVIGRGSSLQFRGANLDLRKVGQTLGARYLVEGSVRKSAGQLKVAAQLVDATDGSTRWSDTYEPSTADTLVLQRKIATAVARALRMTMLDYYSGGGTRSAEAYDLYLRGIRDTDSYVEEAMRRSATELARAVEIDPDYVDGWVALANAYDVVANYNLAPAVQYHEMARQALEKALALDPRNADAYSMRAFLRINKYDWAGAEQDIRKSLELRKSVSAVEAAAKLAFARGNLVEATGLLEGVLASDPLETTALNWLAYPLYPALGRYADADRLYAKMRDLNAGMQVLNSTEAMNALWLGDHQRALRLVDAEPNAAAKQAALAQIYAAMGNRELSNKALELLLQNPAATSDWLSQVYAFRGELDRAFQELDKAFIEREPYLVFLQADPVWANLRRDPRYGALLRKLNLPEGTH